MQATRRDLEEFRAAIVERIGLQFDDAKLGFLGEVLQRRLDKLGRPRSTYLAELQRGAGSGELTALARELTVGETYFFRNIEQFRALAEVALPQRMRVGGAPKALRLLSAGCSSGEEAYSMAIVARETITDPSREVLIRAVDLNPLVLEKAAHAHYQSWALRETPPDIQRKWFRNNGRDMMLDAAIRASVQFQAGNLASDDPELWQPAAYDVIFCRNVLMYFAPEKMRAVIARIAQSLAPGGFLFLGHAETLRGVSDDFHLHHTHETFYYERKECSGRLHLRPPAQATPRFESQAHAGGAPVMASGDAWFHTIRAATDRVAALVPSTDAPAAPADPPPCSWNLAPALDLLRKERFAEALDHVRTGPSEAERDADVLLLEATLLAHSGQIGAAEDACRRLQVSDELNAGAYYVLGLCREQSGDRDRASEHYQVAAYLDPEFAMPRLHLGLLARRAGERDAARRELAQALTLLQREDASRLLLFGGGFSRNALIALCEQSLKDSGGRP